MTHPAAARGCVRCGAGGRLDVLPGGPICFRCRRNIAYHPRPCPECGDNRPLAYPSTISGAKVLVCAGCAGEASVFACTSCGREDQPYSIERCARCVLVERLTELLSDPTTGGIHEKLQPVFDGLAASPRPQSVLTWFQKPPATGKRLLGLMAQGKMPISHDAFRALPSDGAHNYLRELLTAVRVLPPYCAPLERIDRWLEGKLAPLEADTAALISRFARWHVLRRLRRDAEDSEITRGSATAARGHINGAIRLAGWAHQRGTSLTALTQPQLELYLSEYPGGRACQHGFVTWLRESRTNPRLRLATRPSTFPEVTLSEAQRWSNVDALLHDDTIRLDARIGGLFMLLFAQPLSKLCAMTTSQLDLTADDQVLVSFETTPVLMPPILNTLIREHLTRPGLSSIPSQDHGWLFPGRKPGGHLTTEHFRKELVANGIHPGQSRNAARFGLAADLPAPILADLIGIADITATRWAALAARDWSAYIAQRQP